MRVLMLSACFAPDRGGIQRYGDAVASELGRRADVCVVTGTHQRPDGKRPYRHATVGSLGEAPDEARARSVTRDLIAIATDFAPDVIHLLDGNMAVYARALAQHAPLMASLHGNDVTRPWIGWYESARETVARGLRHVSAAFVLSDHVAELAVAIAPDINIVKTPPGCDTATFYPNGEREAVLHACGLAPSLPTILTCARIEARKGLADVLKSLRHLRCPLNWIVVGDGTRRRRATFAARCLLGSGLVAIRRIRNASDAELCALMGASDVFVMVPRARYLSSGLDAEGFGLVYLEAAACGLPVVASDSGGVPEAVAHGVTGLCVPPGDPAAIAVAVGKLLRDPALRRAMGAEGINRVARLNGWGSTTDTIMNAYRACRMVSATS